MSQTRAGSPAQGLCGAFFSMARFLVFVFPEHGSGFTRLRSCITVVSLEQVLRRIGIFMLEAVQMERAWGPWNFSGKNLVAI